MISVSAFRFYFYENCELLLITRETIIGSLNVENR